jgi:hypothetical protein
MHYTNIDPKKSKIGTHLIIWRGQNTSESEAYYYTFTAIDEIFRQL